MNISAGIKTVLSGKAFILEIGHERRLLLRFFWILVFALLFAAVFRLNINPLEQSLGAALVCLASLIPAYLWCKGKAPGMPIFPVFAITHLWTCAIPIYTENVAVAPYSPNEQLFACLVVTGYLLLGTFVWYAFAQSPKPTMVRYLALKGNAAETFFLISFSASTLFTIGAVGGWFLQWSSGAFALLRGLMLGLNSLAAFVLAYRWGQRKMKRGKIALFVLALTGCMVGSAASLLIVGALSLFIFSIIGFALGRRRVPILAITLVMVFLVTLHYGKAEMRAKYSEQADVGLVQPWNYPVWFREWLGYSLNNLGAPKQDADTGHSFLERSSTIQLLLLAQQRTAEGTPLLYGETYAIIPRLLIPRILDEEKSSSHEGNALLNIHYGLQTRDSSNFTTIGWGLLNESYANFGLLGVGGLALLLGFYYGAITRWSMNAPILSARSLFAMVLLNFALQTEFSASVYLTALFQSIVSLMLVVLLFMRPRKVDSGRIVSVSKGRLTPEY